MRSSPLIKQDRRIVVGPVWGNKNQYSLSPPSPHIVILFRGINTTASSKISIKNIHVKLSRDSAFLKAPLTAADQKKLPCGPEHGGWTWLEYRTVRSEACQFVIEFEAPNLVDELVVVRAEKIMGQIEKASHAHCAAAATPAPPAAAWTTVAMPTFVPAPLGQQVPPPPRFQPPPGPPPSLFFSFLFSSFYTTISQSVNQ